MIKVCIVDDHPVVRQGLKEIISNASGMTVVGEAGSGQESLEKLRKSHFDVVVLDISMPGMSGLETLKQIKRTNPKIAVLMLSIYDEELYAVRALRAGAAGYLTKKSAPDELVAAIQKVSLGRKYISSTLAEKLAFNLEADTEKSLHQTLSDREYEVMRMIAQGKTVTEIAGQVFLSPKTISTYRARILEKMRMKNNAELMQYAIMHGLVD